jgi:short-subunit dehydrogenase
MQMFMQAWMLSRLSYWLPKGVNMNLKEKKIVLTGATGGIGEALATALTRAGASLIMVSRSSEKLDTLMARLPGIGHIPVAADITTTSGRLAVIQAAGTSLDGLVNNAGVNHFGLLQDQSEEQLRQMLEVNALAPILLTRSLLPILQQGDSIVVNVGSGFGSIGFAGYSGYSASKFALRGFTEALRRELADSSVNVMYLAPRATKTAMNPAHVVAMNEELGNAMDSPELVATELLALLKKGQGSRFIGWPERFFAKLNGLFPSVVDSALAKQLPVIKRQALAGKHAGS